MRLPLRTLIACVFAAGCLSTGITSPVLIGDGRRILFIGNSLTYTNDLPGIVQALADSARGDPFAVETVAAPDYALIDHWGVGLAQREIAKGWEFVVLQQGPSSVEVNRDTLRLATKLFAPGIAATGGRVALFSVWPTVGRMQDFPRAIESYQLAAADVNGVFLPVATAWLAAWSRDSTLSLYSPDGLHPSVSGSYLSALVIYGRLANHSVVGLPSTLQLRSGGRIVVNPSTARTLQDAAAEALSK
jgi:hypothetical protein